MECVNGHKYLFIASTVAIGAQGELVGKGDIRAQTRKVPENINAVVETAEGILPRVVRTMVYLIDFSNYAGMDKVYKTYFAIKLPARSTIRVGLVNPDYLTEIEAIAVIERGPCKATTDQFSVRQE
jgi:enamine deaminase RidA (YjgF/YER057c/UK114 family)